MKSTRMFALFLLPMLMSCGEEREEKGQTKVAGISHITLTVSNLTASTYFYTKILGGMLANDLSSLQGTSDVEYVKMFTGEVEEQQTVADCAENVTDCTLIKSVSTQWQVYWASVIFDNIMIQLVQYKSLKEGEQGSQGDQVPIPTDTKMHVSPMADMMGTKIAFWVWDSVNLTEYANYLEEESHKHALNKVKFMRPLLLSSTAGLREANQGVRELRDDALEGLSIGFASGPDGEGLKFIQLINSSKQQFGKHYCQAKMVSSALLDTNSADKCGEYKHGNGSHLYGVNHISITTMDINKTISFLVDKMGGYFIDDIQPSHLQSASLSKLILSKLKMPGLMANKMGSDNAMQMDSKMKSKMLNILSGIEINLRYILLGNMKVEVTFLSGWPTGMDGMMDNMPSMMSGNLPSSSFTKLGNAQVAFLFTSKESLAQFAKSVKADNSKGSGEEISRIEDGPFEGLSYTLISTPDKQPIRLVHFSGASKRLLHRNLREYGSVHPVFIGMNPWGYEGYYEFCGKYMEHAED